MLGTSIGLLIGSAFGLINVNVLLIINTWFEKKAQSCKMSYLLHRANLSNQILPHEKCVNSDKFNE